MTLSVHDQVQEVERLANELHDLLSYSRSVLQHRGMHREARSLVHWVDCYRDGLRYGTIVEDKPKSRHGPAWHVGVGDRLKLEGEQVTAVSHSGDSVQGDPTSETENFIELARRIIRNAADVDRLAMHFPSIAFKAAQEPHRHLIRKNPLIHEDPMTQMTQTRVKDLMQKNPVIIPLDYTLREAAQEMETVNCGVLPVGTPERIEGIITDRDIVLRAVARGKDVNKEIVKDYMTPEVCSIQEDVATYRAADLMREKNINRVLVNDSAGRPQGILTFGRILREDESMQEIAIVIECAVGQKAA